MAGGPTGWLKAAFLALPWVGCATAERVDYVHRPTTKLHKTYDLSQEELKPFTVDGVVITPYFKLFTNDETRILVAAIAPTKQKVVIQNAVLKGTGPHRALDYNDTVVTKDEKPPGVLVGTAVLATLTNAELTALAKTGEIHLNLDVRVAPNKDFTTLDFAIERISSREIIN